VKRSPKSTANWALAIIHSRPVSTPASSMGGWPTLASIAHPTGRVQCVAPRQLRSIARPAI
jgi:hypothetical protein